MNANYYDAPTILAVQTGKSFVHNALEPIFEPEQRISTRSTLYMQPTKGDSVQKTPLGRILQARGQRQAFQMVLQEEAEEAEEHAHALMAFSFSSGAP